MTSRARRHFDSPRILYAQCWEDADVMLRGLDVRAGEVCLSIASAGENTLSLLTQDPSRVIAVDLSAAQLACLELRIAAFRVLEHAELLELCGSTESSRRVELYRRCRGALPGFARDFWDGRLSAVAHGFGSAGVLERRLRFFRRIVLPLIHSRESVARLFGGGSVEVRRGFYDGVWNNRRWRAIFHLTFTRLFMGRFGHGPEFFHRASSSLADDMLARVRHVFTELNPAEDPYLQWIFTGRHVTALPHALRAENFAVIRSRLDRLERHRMSIEEALGRFGPRLVQRFNLSNIFEYMPLEDCRRILEQVAATGAPGGRLLYWDMITPRSEPGEIPHLCRREDITAALERLNRTCFYSALVIEDIVGEPMNAQPPAVAEAVRV